MGDFKFSCPHCDQHIKCNEEASGRQIECPACHHLIRIPPVPGKTAEYRPETGQTWGTFVPSGSVPPPSGLSLSPKSDPPKAPGQ
jgi:hypothetical protein